MSTPQEPSLEQRLRTILFDARANTIEDIRDPGLQAEAMFLAEQIEQHRTARKEKRSLAMPRERITTALAKAHATLYSNRVRKAIAAHQMRALGLSYREIGERLHCGRRHVSRLLHEYQPPADLPRCSQCGQPLPEVS